MMGRWGLKGLESFQQINVAKKEKLRELPQGTEASATKKSETAGAV
jgi:hypothetical protein